MAECTREIPMVALDRGEILKHVPLEELIANRPSNRQRFVESGEVLYTVA
jgi:hypothetical protein